MEFPPPPQSLLGSPTAIVTSNALQAIFPLWPSRSAHEPKIQGRVQFPRLPVGFEEAEASQCADRNVLQKERWDSLQGDNDASTVCTSWATQLLICVRTSFFFFFAELRVFPHLAHISSLITIPYFKDQSRSLWKMNQCPTNNYSGTWGKTMIVTEMDGRS